MKITIKLPLATALLGLSVSGQASTIGLSGSDVDFTGTPPCSLVSVPLHGTTFIQVGTSASNWSAGPWLEDNDATAYQRISSSMLFDSRYCRFHSVHIPSGFQANSNSLDFIVNNGRWAASPSAEHNPDTRVPEPGTILAGALLLVPAGAGTARALRKRSAK